MVPPCDSRVCFIIPPHILRGIAASEEAHPESREKATQSLAVSHRIREARASAAASLIDQTGGGHFSGHGIIPPHIHRAMAQADLPSEEQEAAQSSLETSEVLRAARRQPEMHLERKIYTMNHSANFNGLPGKLVRSEGQPLATDKYVNECYDGFGATFDFYSKILSRNSIDDKGLPLSGSIHFGKNFNNALYEQETRQMVFGDPDGRTFDVGAFTKSLDVIGHELTHGVTAFTANLKYEKQPGALNESVSDVFGSMVKQYHLNQKAADADWLIGEGIWADDLNAKALRSMSAPGTAYNDKRIGGKDPQPAHMKNFVKLPNTEDGDWGGVHINSGIPNFAFYKVAIALGGYSWDKAGKIWYRTITSRKLKTDASFEQFANVTAEIALADYGQEVKNVVVKAWTEVGVLGPK